MDLTPEKHAELVGEQAKEETIKKYIAAQKKYGTLLWEYSIPLLVDNAIEESIDEGVYLRTTRQLMVELKSKAAQLFEILENPLEERLDDGALRLMDDIKLLIGL